MSLLFEIDEVTLPDISGLRYFSDFISREEEKLLLSNIDRALWLSDLKRRVQHYGYKYDYKARGVDENAYLGALPVWLASMTQRLFKDGIFAALPDQVIVNEYLPRQGISTHIDCVPCFGDTIASLSLGSLCIMEFANAATQQKSELVLEPCSLVALSGEARYCWTHAIPARKSDIIGGTRQPRQRRISLTFRNVTLR